MKPKAKMNIANRITVARIVMIPLFLVVLLGGFLSEEASRYAAMGIFAIASFSDFLDGYLARKLDMVTNFGKLLDPIADKLLVSAALISLVELGDLAAWMAIVLIGRDLLISGFREIAAEKGHVIAASAWAKVKTAIQMFMIILLLINTDSANTVLTAVCELLKWLSVAFSIFSAYDYIYKNKEILHDR